MKKTLALVLGVSLALVAERTNADFTWTQKANMPTPRWGLFATGVVNGKIYAMGGEPSEPYEVPGDLLSIVEEYDPATDSWTRKADMPTATVPNDATVVDGKIYVIGGEITGTRVIMYDPASDTWTQKADMPAPRWAKATCVVDGKIYAIGGRPSLSDLVGKRTVQEYDPVTDTWTRKADMLFGVWALRTNVVNGKIYALGGRPHINARPYVQEYDPATDTWTQKADMPLAASQMGSVVLGGKIIVIGGWLQSGYYPYTALQMYDPETDAWTIEADAPFMRAGVSAEVVNNRIYAIGGTDRPHPCPALSTVYEFGPLLDFNGDGIVDATDVCMMIDYWGTDKPLYDIAPLPFGDGSIDVQDLILLAEHLFEEIYPTELVAYWKLDEEEDDIAYDSVGDKVGLLLGDPAWHPTGGRRDGALQFDGIDDCVSSDFVLNPAVWKFSVFAWINGGAPGQVFISQDNNANWLMAGEQGELRTDIAEVTNTRSGPEVGIPLISQTIVTDGAWHHIGLVWDGSYRSLYVDGLEVAKDAEPLDSLKSADGGLYIGAGKTLEAGSFFLGMIDDVRIYNMALSAERIEALAQ